MNQKKVGNRVRIRKATPKDVPTLRKLIVEGELDDRNDAWAKDVTNRWVLKPKGKRYILVAEDDKKLVGYVGIKQEESENLASRFIKLNKYAHLTWMMVHRLARHKKIGSKLLKSCEPYARKFKKKGIWLDCRARLVSFYRKNGYVNVGKCLDKKRRYVYVMIKNLT